MQITFDDLLKKPIEVNHEIRLIELFGGVGSQAMALRNIGAKFQHYRLVEFDKYPVMSYNAIHGTNFEPLDIRNIKGEDLGVVNTERYTYLLTYSFPCQDLSLAGKQRGMTKGSGTRSGLLWEVERLLTECNHLAETSYTDYGLPQILLMENVPQVHSKANMPDFEQWIAFLHKMGYENYWQDMNARDYGVAQNRNRCFMVSILGNRTFTFPNKIELKKVMKDYLEDEVEDKYYITSEKAQKLIETLILEGKIPTKNLTKNNESIASVQTDRQTDRQTGVDLCSQHAKLVDIPNTIKARYDSGIINHKYDNTGVCEVDRVY